MIPVRRLIPALAALSLATASLCVHAEESLPGTAAAQGTTVATSTVAPMSAAWGAFSDLAGTAWIDDAGPTSFVYAWQVPNEIMTVTVTGPNGTYVNRLELDADGSGLNLRTDPKLNVTTHLASPRPGVSVQAVPGRADVRVVYHRAGDQVTVSEEQFVNGAWVPQTSRTRRRAGEADVALVAKALADEQAARERDWGVLGRLAGTDLLGDKYFRIVWIQPGKRLLIELYDPDTFKRENWFSFERGEKAGELIETDLGNVPFTVLADGTVYTEDGVNRAWRLDAEGRFTWSKGDAPDGRFIPRKDYFVPARPLTTQEARAFETRIAQVVAEADREKAANAGSDGGWGSAIAGAIGGLAAAAGAGGNASQMISAASQGAAIFSDKPGVQAAAQATAPMLNGGASTATTGSGAGLANATQNAFVKQPDLTPAICAQPLSGDDVQLGTLCSQSYSLYSQYLNAVAQGYSEADCNRTYDAHRKAAEVAANWARDAKAR